MGKRVLFLGLAIVLLVCVSLIAGDGKPWFDMHNCDFCKNLCKDPHLLENMTWNHYDISNGLMSITTVNPKFHESYLEAQKAMEKLGEEMMAGKTDVRMCGMCEDYTRLMALGVKFEVINAEVGDIILMTSDKPDVVDAIHKHGQRTREELVKWEAMEMEKEKKTE